MKLAPNFHLSEFTRSGAAERNGLDNTPGPDETRALTALAKKVLQPLRDILGVPLKITSGYRAPEVNSAVGGSSSSQHVRGEAADVMAFGANGKPIAASDLLAALRSSHIDWDQAITYDNKPHLHVSFTTRRDNRRQVLRYENGKYVAG